MELIVVYLFSYPLETKRHFAMQIVNEMDRRSRLEHVRVHARENDFFSP